MSKPFDPQWVIRARNGDQEAITELYVCAWQEVSIVIRSMIRTDEDTVQDLMQDTFVKAFQRLEQLEDPAKYHAWIKQIARTTTLDYLKKSRAILFSELQDDDSIPIEIEDKDLSHIPDIALDKQETVRLLHEILNSLPEGQRVVLTMHYIQELPVKEIAQMLDRSENTIKVQLRNGRRNLEKKVRELEQKEDIKLYSLAPLPFLLMLLRNMETIPAQPDMALLGDILQNGAVTGSAAAGTATKAAGGITAKQIVAGILAAVTVVGVAAVYSSQSARQEYPEKDLFTEDFRVEFSGENGEGVASVYSLDGYGLDSTVEPSYGLSNGDVVTVILSAPNGEDLEDYCEEHYGFTPTSNEMVYTVSDLSVSDYDALIADYSAFIRGEMSAEEVCVDLSRYTYSCTPALSCLNEEGYFVVRNDAQYSFAEYDINQDSVNELVVLEETAYSEGERHRAIIDIYTFHDGQPIWLIAGAERCEIILCENGIIHEQGSGGAEAIGHCFYEIREGELVLLDSAEMDRGTYYVNGEECSGELFWRTVDQYWPLMEPAYEQIHTVEK